MEVVSIPQQRTLFVAGIIQRHLDSFALSSYLSSSPPPGPAAQHRSGAGRMGVTPAEAGAVVALEGTYTYTPADDPMDRPENLRSWFGPTMFPRPSQWFWGSMWSSAGRYIIYLNIWCFLLQEHGMNSSLARSRSTAIFRTSHVQPNQHMGPFAHVGKDPI